MIIDVSKVGDEGSHYQGGDDPAVLELDQLPGVSAEGPMEYDLFAWKLPGQLLVRGRVSIRLRLQCSRCACFFSTSVADSSFLRDYLVRDGQATVDVTPDLREAVLLELPHYPVCRKDCRGVCPRCGRDLNEGPCECGPPETPGRWSALEKLEL